MTKRKQCVTAFFMTMVILIAVLCGVRIDCTMQYALRGNTTVTASMTKSMPTEWLPPSAKALVDILQTECTVITSWIHTFLEWIA